MLPVSFPTKDPTMQCPSLGESSQQCTNSVAPAIFYMIKNGSVDDSGGVNAAGVLMTLLLLMTFLVLMTMLVLTTMLKLMVMMMMVINYQ